MSRVTLKKLLNSLDINSINEIKKIIVRNKEQYGEVIQYTNYDMFIKNIDKHIKDYYKHIKNMKIYGRVNSLPYIIFLFDFHQ